MKTNDYFHDPFSAQYRFPFGALPLGGEARLALDAPEGVACRLRVWENDSERIIRGRRTGRRVEFYYTPVSTGLKWYYFLLDTPEGRRFYGASQEWSGELFDHEPPAYQLSVYHADFKTPEWFKQGVAYQIFPDRFARGSQRGGLERINTHIDAGREACAREEWSAEPYYLPMNGAKFYSPCDFFGGDIAGIRAKLPYLKELCVSCIYLNPIFLSPSNHRYNTSDYMRLDPMLGTEEEFRDFVSEARELGIRVMLDGVFSHTGDDSVYFDKYARFGGDGAYQSRTSPYFEWYDFSAWPDAYRSWWGFRSLPEVNELTPSYMQFISGLLKKWAALGADSWRLDVADELPDEFIFFLREEIKRNSPDGVILGEVWEDATNKQSLGQRREYADGKGLDCVMNYPFRAALFDFVLMRCDAKGLVQRLYQLLSNQPEPFCRAAMNLLGSHDTPRALTVLSGAPDPTAMTREEQAVYSPDDASRERALKRLALAAAVQFTMLGTPCVYYGDEAGLEGMTDPFCRGTYPWGRENLELLRLYKKLAGLRAGSNALKKGGAAFAANDASKDVFAMLREYRSERVLTVINRSDDVRRVRLSISDFERVAYPYKTRSASAYEPVCRARPFEGEFFEALSTARLSAADGSIELILAPLSAAVLINGQAEQDGALQ